VRISKYIVTGVKKLENTLLLESKDEKLKSLIERKEKLMSKIKDYQEKVKQVDGQIEDYTVKCKLSRFEEIEDILSSNDITFDELLKSMKKGATLNDEA
jgi:uncharacterized protein YlxW (UPF0749 family)